MPETKMTDAGKLDALCSALTHASHCVAFTGAGVSTLSGIRDFRGKNGLYTTGGPDAERMFDLDVFFQDPSVYYTCARDFIYGLEDKQPSVVHEVLARLEARGIVRAVITQNVDLLHQKAGSGQVIEVHGSPSVHRCPACGWETDFAFAAAEVRAGRLPRCARCSAVLKPAITFFGESLPAAALARAEREASAADLLLVLGSSLTVYPAAALPDLTLRGGGRVVVVNDQPTRADASAFLRFSDLQTVFDGLSHRFP